MVIGGNAEHSRFGSYDNSTNNIGDSKDRRTK